MDHPHDHDEHRWSRESSMLLEKLDSLSRKIDHNMSVLSDWAAQQQADLTTIASSLTTVVTGIAALDKMITDFQNSPGTLSASDQAALDGIQSAVKSLVSQSAAINVTPPQVAASAAAARSS